MGSVAVDVGLGVAVGVGVDDALGDAEGDDVGDPPPLAQPVNSRPAARTTAVADETLVPLRIMPSPVMPDCSPVIIGRGGDRPIWPRDRYRERVTRIIAGRAGSLVLDVPDAGTRPTSDRVRESLFGALESSDALRGAAVLDLYAGSGALALEAVSRGAASADLVERSARAAAVIQRNAARVAKAVGAGAAIRVHRSAADTFLRAARGPFDLVFLDPPYDVGEAELSSTLALLVPTLSSGADVVIERAARSPRPGLPDGLVATRDKRYGDTAVWWATASGGTGHPTPASQSR